MYSFKNLIVYVEPQPKTKFPPDPVCEIWFGIKYKRFEAKKLQERMLRKRREQIIDQSKNVVFKNQE